MTYDGRAKWELLEGVPAHDLQQVLAIARRGTFGRGEVVFHQDDPADSLHLVVKGRFAIARPALSPALAQRRDLLRERTRSLSPS